MAEDTGKRAVAKGMRAPKKAVRKSNVAAPQPRYPLKMTQNEGAKRKRLEPTHTPALSSKGPPPKRTRSGDEPARELITCMQQHIPRPSPPQLQTMKCLPNHTLPTYFPLPSRHLADAKMEEKAQAVEAYVYDDDAADDDSSDEEEELQMLSDSADLSANTLELLRCTKSSSFGSFTSAVGSLFGSGPSPAGAQNAPPSPLRASTASATGTPFGFGYQQSLLEANSGFSYGSPQPSAGFGPSQPPAAPGASYSHFMANGPVNSLPPPPPAASASAGFRSGPAFPLGGSQQVKPPTQSGRGGRGGPASLSRRVESSCDSMPSPPVSLSAKCAKDKSSMKEEKKEKEMEMEVERDTMRSKSKKKSHFARSSSSSEKKESSARRSGGEKGEIASPVKKHSMMRDLDGKTLFHFLINFV